MIDEVMVLLKEKLNSYFRLRINSPEDKAAFLDGSKMDPVSFPINCVVPVLLNVEEEKTLRPANRYEGKFFNGMLTATNPPLHLNLTVLFACKFADYAQSLKFLSLVIQFFQRNPLFNHLNTPSLSKEIEKLKIEFITTNLAQKNEIWNSLRTTYLPSVLYKISMLVYYGEAFPEVVPEAMEVDSSITML